jgi:hypothetical protein
MSPSGSGTESMAPVVRVDLLLIAPECVQTEVTLNTSFWAMS